MVLYLCFKYPVKNKLRLGQHITQEIILLAANTCVLTVACLDLTQNEAYSRKKATGEIFLYCNMILSMFGFLFPVLMIMERAIVLAQSKKLSESREVISINRKIHPVNIVHQGDVQANNNSNLVFIQGGLDQSQIGDGSLGLTNLNLMTQIKGKRINKSGLNQINTLETIENNQSMQEESKEAERTQLDQRETTSPARQNIYGSHKQLDPNKSKRKKQNKLQASFKAQHQQSNQLEIACNDNSTTQPGSYKSSSSNSKLKIMTGVSNKDDLISNAISRDNTIRLDPSLKKSEIEASWLRANQERRYQIRGLEQYSSNVREYNANLVDKNKYINEPTHGNHSGVINLLKIKRPHNLDSKIDK